MADNDQAVPAQRELIFPPWVDQLFRIASAGGAFMGAYVVLLVTFGASPRNIAVGYMPEQPVPYSHRLHVGELGLDCRYCHTNAEVGAKAGVPPTSTCMNCHTKVRPDSDKLAPLKESYEKGTPMEWVKVHDLGDYAYFNHSAHVRRGVGCATCHGRIDTMEEVFQDQPLSMGWCLDCHRNPEPNVRPLDKITDMTYQPNAEEGREVLRQLRGWTPENRERKIR
ncbi:MAG: cytochrome c3 family protein [Planctomycetota bacterium]